MDDFDETKARLQATRTLLIGLVARRLRARYDLDDETAAFAAEALYFASDTVIRVLEEIGVEDPGDAADSFIAAANLIRELATGDSPRPRDN